MQESVASALALLSAGAAFIHLNGGSVPERGVFRQPFANKLFETPVSIVNNYAY